MSRFFGRGRSFHGHRRGFLRADLVFRIMRGLGFWDEGDRVKKHIFLIGFMGCGKSTNAAVLAALTDRRQIEMDEEIAAGQGMPVQEIFKNHGEAFFRDLETALLEEMQERKNMIISCGGGTALRQRNVEEMKKNGRVVLLTASPQTIYERVKDSDERPVLKGRKNVEDIAELMEQRREKYEAAADKSVLQVCEELVQRLTEMEETNV